MFVMGFIFPSVLLYIGPGLGGGVLAIIIGFLLSLFVALFAIVWYPMKKLLQKYRKKKLIDKTQTNDNHSPTADE